MSHALLTSSLDVLEPGAMAVTPPLSITMPILGMALITLEGTIPSITLVVTPPATTEMSN